jgi:hypothetical protein
MRNKLRANWLPAIRTPARLVGLGRRTLQPASGWFAAPILPLLHANQPFLRATGLTGPANGGQRRFIVIPLSYYAHRHR